MSTVSSVRDLVDVERGDMQSPETGNRHNTAPPLNLKDSFVLRRRKAQWLVSGMLCLSLIIVVLGIYSSTRTESVSISGYTSGIILAFGSFLGVLGLCLEENRKKLEGGDNLYRESGGGWQRSAETGTDTGPEQLVGTLIASGADYYFFYLVAAIVFLSFGIISSFLCLLIDGVFILLTIDVRPLKAGRCQFYISGNSYIYENYYATVPCQGLTEACTIKVRSGTCYCCDLYNCANGGYLNSYYEFVGVQSCQDVLSLYVLLWILTVLNLLGFLTGILTTAVLGSIKDMKSWGVSPDVPRWGGSSLLSFEGGHCSSPTAPLLLEARPQSGPQLYPRASLYISPPSSGFSVQQTESSGTSNTQTNPPAFAPLYNLLPNGANTSNFST